MQKVLGIAISALALISLVSVVRAADIETPLPVKAPAVAPEPSWASGYLELYAGTSTTTQNETFCEFGFGCESADESVDGAVLGGAARGNYWFLPYVSGQLDVQAEGTSRTVSGSESIGTSTVPVSERFSTESYLVGGHLNWRDPNTGLLGVFGAGGDAGDQGETEGNQRHYLGGVEGQYYWRMVTLYLQGGYDSTPNNPAIEIDSVHEWFVRGTARWFIDPNLLVEATGVYANGAIDFSPFAMMEGTPSSFGFNTMLAQAKIEWRPASVPISLFAKYQWAQTRYDTVSDSLEGISVSNKIADNRWMVGARLYFAESSLLSNDHHGATLDIIDPLGSAVSPLTMSEIPSAGEVVLSDIRLKRDIEPIGQLENGLRLYRYRYLWDDTVYVGVMAQEVAEKVPGAVMMGDDGYLRVNYQKLGLRLRTLDEWDAMTYGIRLN
jgi:hypothetical protein